MTTSTAPTASLALGSLPADLLATLRQDMAAHLDSAMGVLRGLRRRVPTVALFAASSLSSWTVDYVLVLLLNSMTDSVLLPVVMARLVSCTMNFLINRRLFNADPATLWSSAAGYATVQSSVMTASYLLIAALQSAGAPLWLAKILADSVLFAVNYLVQSRLVYRARRLPSLRSLRQFA
ncbi:GtrA family protein [Actinomyces slackii]|uniref:GtrA-like protein n=1 Tax=Actinomyces slackii TaxID=52774 RepID=A0A3S4ST55_9ACTO|nr:GtrA family protein [Actinomyces slackii]VEG74474.1 GtrA-like protein [Actinomyces slackii]